MQLFLTISAFHPHTRLELMTQSVRVQISLIIVRVLQLHAHIWLNQNLESYYEQNKQLTLLLLTPDLPSNMIMIILFSHHIFSYFLVILSSPVVTEVSTAGLHVDIGGPTDNDNVYSTWTAMI